MTRHVSAETLAGFRQGDLSQRRRSRIGAHLAGCSRCRALNEDLADVTTLLATVRPPPMPEHLAARIQTALATEAANRVTAPAGNQREQAAPGPGWRPHLPHLGSRVALGTLAAAAALVLLVGGIYDIALRGGGSPTSSGSAASEPAARPAGQSAGNGVMAPAAPVFGPVLRYRHAGRQQSVTPITTDTDFTPATLSSQATAAVTRYGSALTHAGPNAGPASPEAAPGKRAAAFGNIALSALEGCVNRMAAGELVLLVDVARYRGAPATIIVTELAVTGPRQIWVVGRDCSGSRSDVLTHATATAPG